MRGGTPLKSALLPLQLYPHSLPAALRRPVCDHSFHLADAKALQLAHALRDTAECCSTRQPFYKLLLGGNQSAFDPGRSSCPNAPRHAALWQVLLKARVDNALAYATAAAGLQPVRGKIEAVRTLDRLGMPGGRRGAGRGHSVLCQAAST
jgi:hypothetical protein